MGGERVDALAVKVIGIEHAVVPGPGGFLRGGKAPVRPRVVLGQEGILRGLPLSAPERFCHAHEIISLRLRHEPGQRQKLPALLLRQLAAEMITIGARLQRSAF